MKRYIVDKKGIDILKLQTVDACNELAQEKIITNEQLKFSNLPFVSLVLNDQQVAFLKSKGINPTEEIIRNDAVLGKDYEKQRGSFYKLKKRGLTGRGVKVGVFDSGCNTAVVPCEFTVNYADANPFADVLGHGTQTTSIVKHPTMGLAPNCQMHHVKVLDDLGSLTESAALAACDYAIDNNLDVINLSWQFDTTSVRAAIAAVISNGTVVCASSGNSSTINQVLIPAGLPNVIAVNSIGEDGSVHDLNILPNTSVPVGAHGITIACAGWGTEVYTKNGTYTSNFGTSFASPYFAGVFAVYKETLGVSDNYRVLQQILHKALKTPYPNYFGVGTPTF